MTESSNPTSPKTLETYALLQIAAEALFGRDREAPAMPVGNHSFALTETILTTGNLHSSKMTTEQAKQFASEWKVTSHQPNTAAGFSGTLSWWRGKEDESGHPVPG